MFTIGSLPILVPADHYLCHFVPAWFSYNLYDHKPNAKSYQDCKCVTQPQVEVWKITAFNISPGLREVSKIFTPILKNLLLPENFLT